MKYKPITMIAVASVLAALFMGTASAQFSRTRVPAGLRHRSLSAPVLRRLANGGTSRDILRNSGNRSRGFSGRTGRPLLDALANGTFSGNTSGRNGQTGRPLLDVLSNGTLSGNAYGNTGDRTRMPLLNALVNGGTGWGQGSPYYGYHGNNGHHEYSMPEAYRDAAIANSLVDVVGILSQNAQQPTAPVNRYVREKVVLAPEHYETYPVWIPPIYDSRTGQKIGGGYNETRTQLVPEVAEYRDVLVNPGQ